MLRKVLYPLAISVLVLSGMQASAQNQKNNPYGRSDSSWITIDGIVVEPESNSFTIDYGEGTITVEMDDWDSYKEGALISDGDKVTVTGRVDADMLERRTIEASSVYVDDRNTYYFASAADEEMDPYFASTAYYSMKPLGDGKSRINLTGIVSELSGREFTLRTSGGKIQVDTSTMKYNPLDRRGLQQVTEGDRVSVNGRMDMDFFEDREIVADSVLRLEEKPGRQG